MSETQDSAVDMGEYTRHDLMVMSATEAKEQLTDEQFSEWARLNDLQQDLQQTQQEYEDARETVINHSVERHRDEAADTGTWHGSEITYELDTEKLAGMDDDVRAVLDNPEQAREELDSPERLKDVYAKAFAALWLEVDHVDLTDEAPADVEYWIRHEVVETWGLRQCGLVLGEQITQSLQREQELQEAVNKFRGEMGADSGGPPAHNRSWQRR